MLVNNTSRSLRFITTIPSSNIGVKGNVSAGETVALPVGWVDCHLMFKEMMTQITPGHPHGVTTTPDNGKVLLCRKGDAFILRDNQQHILFVRNYTNYPITFWNSSECSPEYTVVAAKTWAAVVGKTSVCSVFSDEEVFFLGKDVVQIDNLTVTFSPRKGNPVGSNVTITQ